MTGCILCLCLRRWGSAVADLNLCDCLCCPAQPFPLPGGCGRAPGAVAPGRREELLLHQGDEEEGRKSKRDRHVLPQLTLQPSWNASDSSWSSSHPLAPIHSSSVPFCTYIPSPSIYFKPHWPLPVFLTPFAFPRKTTLSARFCDPFPQALHTHLPPRHLVWILPVLLSSLSTACLLEAHCSSLLTTSWHFPLLSCSCPSSPPSIPAGSSLSLLLAPTVPRPDLWPAQN